MEKKISFIISMAAMFACFANAQTTEPAVPAAPSLEQSEPATVEATPATEQTPEAAPEVAQSPAPIPEAVPQEPEAITIPALTPEPQAVRQEASPVTAPAPTTTNVVEASVPVEQQTIPQNQVDQIRQEAMPKHVTHFGGQASIGSSEYIGESVDDMSDGLTGDVGLFATIPITDNTLSAEIGAKFIYRKVSNTKHDYLNPSTGNTIGRKNSITAYSIGIPLVLDLFTPNSNFYFSFGAQIEVPIKNQLQISFNGENVVDQDLVKNQCAPFSWDFVLGLGFNATNHFGIDARINIGISDIYDNLNVDNIYWSYSPIDIILGLKFFL